MCEDQGTRRQALCVTVHLHICDTLPLDNSRLTHTPSTAVHNNKTYNIYIKSRNLDISEKQTCA